MIGLTRKQRELYDYIAVRLTADGIAPSFAEMGRAIGMVSVSRVHRLLLGLEERGYIRRMPHRPRAIELVKQEESAVTLNAEVLALADQYAERERKSRKVAVNELLRAALLEAL